MPRKSRPNLFDLPALELACMKAVWALGEATVEDVRAHLLPERPLAYTTVMTVMGRLARKGLVSRSKRGRAHVYASAVARESVRDHAVARLVENFFGGSREDLRAHLSGASPDEFKERMPVPPPQPAPRPEVKREEPAPPAEKMDTSLL